MLNILFFGQLAELAENHLGTSQLQIETNYFTNPTILIQDVIEELCSSSPGLKTKLIDDNNLIAINQEMLEPEHCLDTAVKSGDEIAFMSPLSGG